VLRRPARPAASFSDAEQVSGTPAKENRIVTKPFVGNLSSGVTQVDVRRCDAGLDGTDTCAARVAFS